MELIHELDELEKAFVITFKGQVIHNFDKLEKYKEVSKLLIRQEKPPTKNNSKEFRI